MRILPIFNAILEFFTPKATIQPKAQTIDVYELAYKTDPYLLTMLESGML